MPNWNKILSYIHPVVIHRELSEHGYHLEVTWENGRLVLNTNRANYSFGSLHKVFQKAFKKHPPQLSGKDEVAVLGFGVGSVAHILRHELGYQNPIIGVEHDAQVIALGEWFFETKQLENVEIIQEDAQDFLEERANKYKVIIVDLFNQLEVNELFTLIEFIELLKERLVPGGQVYFNFVTNNVSRKNQWEKLLEVSSPIFSKSTTYKATNINKVLILENGMEK